MYTWEKGKEVKPLYESEPEKDCEGVDCSNKFRPSGPWGARRCARCRKEKRPYKDA